MGFSAGNGTVSSTISGTVQAGVGIPSATQTVINIYHSGTGAAADAYTVTAGKTFYLMGVATYDGGTINVFKNDGATLIALLTCNAGDSYNICSSTPIWAYTATQVVKVNGALNKKSILWGIEQ